MKNSIFALPVLAFFATGCAQILPVPAASSPSEPAPGTPVIATSPDNAAASAALDVSMADAMEAPVPDQEPVILTVEETAEQPGLVSREENLDRKAPRPQQEQGSIASEAVPETEQEAELKAEPGDEQKAGEAVESELVQTELEKRQVQALCNEIGNKLGSVSVADCLAQPLAVAGGYTVQSRPLVIRDFSTNDQMENQTRILVLGGIHGDEYSSISIMFKWMAMLDSSGNHDFRWRFAPAVNPDGLLDGQAVRQNANGVDLNRNFPSEDWLDLAEEYWNNSTHRNPRRYPGSHPASEPEVQWVVEQIKSYKPDVIVSVHAPYHLLDYDGPPEPPQKIGELRLHLLGVYPGSLGNYAGINLGIPVVTMELPSAGIMPASEQITSMWNDLLKWLYEHHET